METNGMLVPDVAVGVLTYFEPVGSRVGAGGVVALPGLGAGRTAVVIHAHDGYWLGWLIGWMDRWRE